MKKKQLELLEDYLWELTRQINFMEPGLPVDWMQRRAENLADIFRPNE